MFPERRWLGDIERLVVSKLPRRAWEGEPASEEEDASRTGPAGRMGCLPAEEASEACGGVCGGVWVGVWVGGVRERSAPPLLLS